MTRWEYGCVVGGSDTSTWQAPDGSTSELSKTPTAVINELGQQGWELVAVTETMSIVSGFSADVTTTYHLKRPLG